MASQTSNAVQWLKELWNETLARYAVLIGIAGNVVTFLFPGLRSNALHAIALGLLVVGIIWANVRVYGKQRSALAEAQAALDKKSAEKPTSNFPFSMAIVGSPPSPQFIRVTASRTVCASRLEYLASDGACIATDGVRLEGETFDIPIEEGQLAKLENAPRVRNDGFGSGPVKLRVKLSVDGEVSSYVLPASMQISLRGSTIVRKLTGSEEFRWSTGRE